MSLYLCLIFDDSKENNESWMDRIQLQSRTAESDRRGWRVQWQHGLYRQILHQQKHTHNPTQTDVSEKIFLIRITFKSRMKRKICMLNTGSGFCHAAESESSEMSIACFWAVERVSREVYAPHPSHHPLQQGFYRLKMQWGP
jgi:hypothetical protein